MTVRPRIVAPVWLAIFALLLSACGGAGGEGNGATGEPTADGGGATADGDSAEGEPLVIGVNVTKTGPLGVFEEDIQQAVSLAVKQANAEGGPAGHPVEIVTVENDGTPEGAVEAARRLVEREGASYITGLISSGMNQALQEQLDTLDAVSINTLGIANSLRGEACHARAFHFVHMNEMYLNAALEIVDDWDVERWAIAALDYEGGRDPATAFINNVEAGEGEIATEQYPPLGADDFGPYISELANADADGLMVAIYGGDAVSFFNQAGQFGLFENYERVLSVNAIIKPLFEPIGENALGTFGTVGWTSTLDDPHTKEFVSLWEQEYGEKPYYVEADGYLGLQGLFAAVEKAGSIEPNAVAEAMNGLEFEGITGTLKIRPEDGQALRTSYLGEVVQGDDGLEWEVLAEAGPDVTTPEANPACSR